MYLEAAGVEVHVAREQRVARGRRDDLERRHEGKVRHRAVACHEEDRVAARRDLPRDRLEVVPGRVHEVVPT